MSLSPLQSDILNADPVRHAFFTREGGVSEGLYESLNCGPGSKDAPESVVENRRRCAEHLGAPVWRLQTLYQVHSPVCIRLTEPLTERPQADAMVTDRPGLAIGVLTADCAPILFADVEAGVIGAAHAGWKGALGGVAESTLAEMEALGAQRARIRAAVGPAIAQASYEVGPEFRDTFIGEMEAWDRFFEAGQGDRALFDLTGYVRHRLRRAGIADPDILPVDTYADARFFSYRRATHRKEPDYGRQLSAIMLSPT